MKRYLLSLVIFCLLGCVSAAQSTPLERAKAYYADTYPLGELPEWSAQNNGYVVSFYDRAAQRATEMEFDHKGRWRETTISIDAQELSPAILQYVEQRFEQYYTTAYKLKRKRKQPYFGLVVDTPTHIHTLLFKANGHLIEQYSEGLDGG